MIDILRHFESAMGGAERLSPAVLIGLGVATVAAGLFVWLAGLSFKKVLAATSGAIGGGIVASVVIGWTAPAAAVAVAAVAIIAAIFEKVFVTALAAGLATAAGIAFFIGPYIEIGSLTEAESRGDGPVQVTALNTGQSIRRLGAWIVSAGGQIRQACSQMQAYKWALAIVSGLIVVAGGSLLWRPTAALYFSAAGTMLVFAGMILLLLYKGVMAVSRICRMPSVYAGVFAAMVFFGTAEQLLLCRGGKTQSGKKETGKNKDNSKGK